MAGLDAQFFNPFLEGTIKTLKVSCRIDAKPGKLFLKGTQPQPSFEIAGIIGITSPTFTGSITLCFPEKVYLSIMSNMLGETFTSLTPELQDGAAELLNMIFGHAKVVLNQQGHTIQKALPTIIRGANLQTSHLGNPRVMVLPFHTDVGELHVEISEQKAK